MTPNPRPSNQAAPTVDYGRRDFHRPQVVLDPGRRLALKAEILAAGRLLGLLQADPEAWLKTTGASTLASIEIERLVELRVAARRAKNFAEADRIRDRLVAAGVILEDGPEGTRWRLAG